MLSWITCPMSSTWSIRLANNLSQISQCCELWIFIIWIDYFHYSSTFTASNISNLISHFVLINMAHYDYDHSGGRVPSLKTIDADHHSIHREYHQHECDPIDPQSLPSSDSVWHCHRCSSRISRTDHILSHSFSHYHRCQSNQPAPHLTRHWLQTTLIAFVLIFLVSSNLVNCILVRVGSDINRTLPAPVKGKS